MAMALTVLHGGVCSKNGKAGAEHASHTILSSWESLTTYIGAGTLWESPTVFWTCRLCSSPLVGGIVWTAVVLIDEVRDQTEERSTRTFRLYTQYGRCSLRKRRL